MSALLGETTGPGLGGRKVTRVALQQAAFGEPMDDVIIDATAADDSVARLSLQVKRALVISAARSDADFRDVVVKGSATLREEGFRRGVDRVGAATGTVAAERQRALEWLCARARASGGLVS